MPRGRDYPVRELRQQIGLTQDALAREIGVTSGTVARWERGASKPTPIAIKALEVLARRAAREGKEKAA
jgi:DNA-binding transcriptional regulator YiaG